MTGESFGPVCCLYCGCDSCMTSVVLGVGIAFKFLGIGVASGVSGTSRPFGKRWGLVLELQARKS